MFVSRVVKKSKLETEEAFFVLFKILFSVSIALYFGRAKKFSLPEKRDIKYFKVQFFSYIIFRAEVNSVQHQQENLAFDDVL